VGPLALGLLSGPAEVGAFGVATRIESMARRLPYAAFGAALPVFSASVRRARVRARLERAIAAFAAGAALTLVVAGGPLVRLLYGASFAAATVPLMWAAAALVPSLVNASRKVYLNAIGGERIVVRLSTVALTVQVAAAIVFVPRLGATGAVLALAAGDLAIWWPLRAADRPSPASDRMRDATPMPASASM
jgi:O-antigen/teichoic acid export membrane protein